MTTQDIAGLIPTAHSLAILGNALPKKKKKTKLVKTATESIVGLSILPTTAQLAGSV